MDIRTIDFTEYYCSDIAIHEMARRLDFYHPEAVDFLIKAKGNIDLAIVMLKCRDRLEYHKKVWNENHPE